MLEVIRHGPDGTEIHVPCPPAEFDYQQFMRGVDRGDQVMKPHNAARKSRKAWKKLFSYGLEISIMNAFIIEDSFQPHSRPGHCNRTFLDFCLELAAQLIANQSFRKKIGRAPSLPESDIDSLRLNGKSHEISYKEKRLDCVVCAEVVRVNSLDLNQCNKSYICVTCGNKPLCINSNRNCWQKWHSLRQYWN